MKEIKFNIPDALADKFELAVQLTGDNRDALAEQFIRDYLGNALRSAANEFSADDQTPPPPPPRGDCPPPPPPPPFANGSQPHRAKPDHQRPPRPDYWEPWGKANQRIPRWAKKPQQNNHKILRAFFELQQEMSRVTLDALRRRCSDPVGHPKTYVPHFDNNFAQMKFDRGNSHGKVFEEHDGYITIWDRISDTLQKYRDYFLF